MAAFAANSLLNRLAMSEGEIGPGGFAAVRVTAGIVVLAVLLLFRDASPPQPRKPHLAAVAGLSLYMVGFSFAYVSMDAGVGALILFGGVQITMFSGALLEGDIPPARRWVGMVLAVLGLTVLTRPSGPITVSFSALMLMGSAAVGWGIYSLAGRKVSDPVLATAWNFFYSLPVILVVLLLRPDTTEASLTGITLAALSGGITSALGYALWYSLIPQLGATRGALAQLSAPAIAVALGALILGEVVSWTSVGAAGLILGGIAVGLIPWKKSGGRPAAQE